MSLKLSSEARQRLAQCLLVDPQVAPVRDDPKAQLEGSAALLDATHHEAGGPVVPAAGGEDGLYGPEVVRVVELARDAEGVRQVEVADPEDVDAGDGGDSLDILDAAGGLDLRDQEGFPVGGAH